MLRLKRIVREFDIGIISEHNYYIGICWRSNAGKVLFEYGKNGERKI
jgi:hypothetical protein